MTLNESDGGVDPEWSVWADGNAPCGTGRAEARAYFTDAESLLAFERDGNTFWGLVRLYSEWWQLSYAAYYE